MSERISILNIEPQGYSESARVELLRWGKVDELELNRENLLEKIGSYEILIVRLAHQINREVIEAAPRLKAIVSATTGLDHIDITYARNRGIEILSLQGENDFLKTISASAEHTWALLLALRRRIPSAFASVKRGEWDRDIYKGNDLDGARLGIVGLGRVGRKVATYGLAFNMSVYAFDPFVKDWDVNVDRMASLDHLMESSNVVSLHIPLNNDTNCMIGAKELDLMHNEAVLINTSRGKIIDEHALVSALESGRLAGAALDVLSNERSINQLGLSPLLTYAKSHQNLIITPHVGGATSESMSKTELFMAQKLGRYLMGNL